MITADPTDQRLDPERLLYLIAEATSAQTGTEFFRALMRRLAMALNVRCSFITECLQQPPTAVRTLAYWDHGHFLDNVEYELADTPCEQVIGTGTICLVPQALGDRYACERGVAESYFGVPIFDAAGNKVIGHMAFLDDKPMADDQLTYAVFDIFAARAGAELQRRLIEQALRASEEKYRTLVEQQTDMVVQLDPAGHLLFASPSYCDAFGTDPTDSRFIDTVHEEDRSATAAALQSLAHPPHACAFEHRARTRRGWAWLSWSLKAVRGANGEISEIVGVGRDVSQRRHAEEQTRQNLQDLAHAARLSSIGEMASALAHELNQPLTTILSFSQACQRQLGNTEVPVEIRQALDRVIANAQRAGDIIHHMRDFVRKTPVQRSAVDIQHLISVVADLVEPELRQRNIVLRHRFATTPPAVVADPIQIQQVMVNLIRNSMEALAEIPVEQRNIFLEIEDITPGMLTLSVRDTGPGLAPHVLDRLFEPFVSTKLEGLGIGLAICRSIIENHGGRLYAVPHAEGAVFRFTLPLLGEGHAQA
jgi:two-component system sensor kinase FixL